MPTEIKLENLKLEKKIFFFHPIHFNNIISGLFGKELYFQLGMVQLVLGMCPFTRPIQRLGKALISMTGYMFTAHLFNW